MKVYLIVDRSISMLSMMNEAVEAINSYIRKLPRDTKLFLATFDTESCTGAFKYEIIRDCAVVDCQEIKYDEVTPRGWTPLYDAVAMTINKGVLRNEEKAILVVMTDGFDTSSKEYDQHKAKLLISNWENRGYEVVFLGANFPDVEHQSQSLGVVGSKTLNFAHGNMMRGMDILSKSTMAYAIDGTKVSYSNNIKAELNVPKTQ